MDRGKSGPGRGGKSKVPQHPAEVYALGSKSGNEAKRTVPVPHAKAGPSHHLSGKLLITTFPTPVTFYVSSDITRSCNGLLMFVIRKA